MREAAVGRFSEALAGLLFPPVCVHCRGLVEAGPHRHLCAACARGIEFIRGPCCGTCGHPPSGLGRQEGCPHCEGLEPFFDRSRSAVLFRGAARSLILELKYHRGLHVLGDIETVFRDSPEVLGHARNAVLVPVPLHPRKRRERGFNQAEAVAEALRRAAGGATCVAPLLRRVADTPSQTAFGRRARQAGLKNAFALAPGADLNPRLRHVLVDDVFTTGSTLSGCAQVLRRAGCLSVEAATFAHG